MPQPRHCGGPLRHPLRPPLLPRTPDPRTPSPRVPPPLTPYSLSGSPPTPRAPCARPRARPPATSFPSSRADAPPPPPRLRHPLTTSPARPPRLSRGNTPSSRPPKSPKPTPRPTPLHPKPPRHHTRSSHPTSSRTTSLSPSACWGSPSSWQSSSDSAMPPERTATPHPSVYILVSGTPCTLSSPRQKTASGTHLNLATPRAPAPLPVPSVVAALSVAILRAGILAGCVIRSACNTSKNHPGPPAQHSLRLKGTIIPLLTFHNLEICPNLARRPRRRPHATIKRVNGPD